MIDDAFIIVRRSLRNLSINFESRRIRAALPHKSVFHPSAAQSIRETFMMETITSKDPRAHTANIRGEFRELIQHLRDDIEKVEEPKARALFETAAEVLSGLETAFKHYEDKSEPAWK